MTFSITAHCHRTGELGVGVTTAWLAVGSLCPAVRAGIGAVASQAFINPALRGACLDRMAHGLAPEAVLNEALSEDSQAERRQVGLIDAAGRAAAHTGASCVQVCDHIIEPDCAIAGNMLAPGGVLQAVAKSWRETRDTDMRFAERLLAALDAGQAAGGDMRGRQSAALLVGNENPLLQIDLRVDDHSDPLIELRRLLTLFREKYEPLIKALAAQEH